MNLTVDYARKVGRFLISAGHNLYYDNGNGEKMDETIINLVEAYFDGELKVYGQRYKEISFAHIENEYILKLKRNWLNY